MYECPNCAGNLKFDITRQQLYCEQCGTQADPYSFYKEKDAEEGEPASGEYEATVFVCPQCGAELISEDVTAATFCSFCGASTILDSRISREKRPKYIIPFTRTKEDCRSAYKKLLRRAVFAPGKLRDEALIEKFRGIYMPYWVYSFKKKGTVEFPGKTTRRKGDYLIMEHYRMDCEVQEEYNGLAYDASSTFSDSLSSAIAPFDLRQSKDFAPSFLSGFYADTSDVDKYVYLSEAEELVLCDAVRQLSQDSLCRKYGVGQGEQQHVFKNALRPSQKTVELAMLPVWFLSCRSGDRVGYAVVNGQTGKAAADLPVDGKKYFIGSFLLAIPIFFLLNLFLTMTPGKILLAAAVLTFVCVLISNGQMTHIIARESGEDDKGAASVKRSSGAGNFQWKRKRHVPMPWDSSLGKIFLLMFLFYVLAVVPRLLFFCISLAIIIFSGDGRNRQRSGQEKPFLGGHFKEKWPTLRKPLLGIALAAAILLINPVSDWFYYAGAFACMGTALWAVMDIIRQHNVLTTRKLPQLGRRGGDEG